MKMRRYFIPALLLVMGLPALGVSQNARTPSARSRQAYYLGWQFERLRSDAGRLSVLAGMLRTKVEEGPAEGMPEDAGGRVKALHQQAQKLFTAVQDASRNQLSFEIVQMAAAIEQEGKNLRKAFETVPSGDRRKVLRNLANKIRKKAESVRKKMRMP